MATTPPDADRFSPTLRHGLHELMRWRRDVRHFRTDPVDEALLLRCFDAFRLAPSVGLSQPWRIVRVDSAAARAAARDNFEAANATALKSYDGAKAALYPKLKLSGMDRAPVQLAVFCDEETPQGSGLGAATMPEMRRYSVVAAVSMFWLAARAEGLGVGWVSVLDPIQLARDLDVPDNWTLVSYLCIGWPEVERDHPELEEAGWERRAEALQIEER